MTRMVVETIRGRQNWQHGWANDKNGNGNAAVAISFVAIVLFGRVGGVGSAPPPPHTNSTTSMPLFHHKNTYTVSYYGTWNP